MDPRTKLLIEAPITPTLLRLAIPNVITAPSYCGSNRFLFSFLSPDNKPIGSPELKAKVAFYDLGRDPSGASCPAARSTSCAGRPRSSALE